MGDELLGMTVKIGAKDIAEYKKNPITGKK